LFKSKLKS